MKLNKKTYTTKLNGEDIVLEISELAGQANAAVIGRHGNTTVLATVVMGKENKDVDFFPLSVDYEERFYAAGKIIGSRFIRREGRPSDEAILSSRLIDRTIRPLFDHRIRREIQVTVTVLSYDDKHDPDTIGLLATSTALSISDIPWNGPVAGINFLKTEEGGEIIHRAFFAGPETHINMIELEGKEISEDDAIKIFQSAQKTIAELIAFQKQIIREVGKPKSKIEFRETDSRVKNIISDFVRKNITDALKEKKLGELLNSLIAHLVELGEDQGVIKEAQSIFEEKLDAFVHEEALANERRPDGRGLDEIRPLHAEVGLFEITHGSGLFIRGNTQILAVTTLASPSAEQLIESMEGTEKKRFMLHYNFPSFSVGEVGRSRGPGRREIGHGALAAKAFRAVIPPKDKFPYTIRIVAETLSSNGSSSMASVCAGSLSLMDAGVPISSHVAGIAMGLMLEPKSGKYKILTDIQGPEDHYGDMDCKVAGTIKGITAIQMDVKICGITEEIFSKALVGAKEARLEILKVMSNAIPVSRESVSAHAPKILTITIPKEKIGELIGPGGRNINGIIAASLGKITIDIEENGNVFIAGVDEKLVRKAYDSIGASMKEYNVGEVVTGAIIKILDFGAIMDLGGNKDGLIHISELKDGFVKKVEDVIHLGDVATAKVIRIDPDGRIGLSLKNLAIPHNSAS